MKKIAQEAGFVNVKLCDEPTGVIYFNHFFGGLKFKKSQNILVYDFGGGTTDVAIARVDIADNGEIKPVILAVGGLPNLGGSDFDESIAAHYLSENHYGLNTLSSKDRLHDKWVIGLAAREAKEELSSKNAVEKTINRLKVTGGAKPQKFSLSRDDFMNVCAELIEKFDEPVYDALTYAGLSPEDIDFVILAGGSSAMPYVMEKMSEIFPANKIFMSSSPEVIAQGLAVFGKVQKLKEFQYENEPETISSSAKTKTERTVKQIPVKAKTQSVRKKGKLALIASIAASMVIAGGILYYSSVIRPENNYKNAVSLKDSGQYQEAIDLFKKLKDYKDSTEQIRHITENLIPESKYKKAVTLKEAGQFSEAAVAFNEIVNYKDSQQQLESVKIFLALHEAAVGDYIKFGKYEQDNNLSNGKEDIEWLVLAKENDRLLVISRYALDLQQYHMLSTSISWEDCTLRHWLNDTFINAAFSDSEKAVIPTVEVNADENPRFSTPQGNDTQDKIFLLSIKEASNYLKSEADRKCQATAYLKSQRIGVAHNNLCWWWLRTVGGWSNNAVFINYDGKIYHVGNNVDNTYVCVRPALWIGLIPRENIVI